MLERDQNSTTTPTPTENSTSSEAFPTDVGYLGTTRSGMPPFLVEVDRLNLSSTRTTTRGNSPVETRWFPIDGNSSSSEEEQFDIFKNLGNVSPYFSSQLFPETRNYSVLNETCKVEQVHMLHRHGSRYPTSYSTEGAPFFGSVINSIKNSSSTSYNPEFEAEGPLSFLNDWTYQLGAEVLVGLGRQQLFDSGVRTYYQYGRLYNESSQAHKPVVRTTSQSRMLDSARYFTLGFFGWDAPEKVDLEVILEGGSSLESGGFNDTLASYDTCDNANEIYFGDDPLASTWIPIYLANATERLQPYVKGLELNYTLVYGMQSLCAYETSALGYSDFCSLFTRSEWEGFEYSLDLEFQGDYGFMSPSGKAQGIGYVQEFLDRLTNTTLNVSEITTQNTTFDLNPTYFPLDQSLYFDFSHDDIILSVLVALNYTQFSDFLDPSQPDPKRNFKISNITPFAARLFFEIIDCQPEGEKYIRTILNEAIVPMDEGQGCDPPRKDGLCSLQQFIDHQKATAYQAANFDLACYGKNGTDFVVTGPVRNGTLYGSLNK
ncbi:phosphoglycerate mutase-like protein [Violaceomyces palustris]|uniref:Phosphoglycerate mutase-like protein n=1 Tax=Violaceomyces palustris TaxID=1673888 RepID=A0ACD0P4X0_9BASI|nr:phosphoglycerate mutase-like protein [Violaceomyces palustris]